MDTAMATLDKFPENPNFPDPSPAVQLLPSAFAPGTRRDSSTCAMVVSAKPRRQQSFHRRDRRRQIATGVVLQTAGRSEHARRLLRREAGDRHLARHRRCAAEKSAVAAHAGGDHGGRERWLVGSRGTAQGRSLGARHAHPALVVSPFAKSGFVDHTIYDTGSILRFITRRFGLEKLPGLKLREDAMVAAGGRRRAISQRRCISTTTTTDIKER
jgi:hypothetical protein